MQEVSGSDGDVRGNVSGPVDGIDDQNQSTGGLAVGGGMSRSQIVAKIAEKEASCRKLEGDIEKSAEEEDYDLCDKLQTEVDQITAEIEELRKELESAVDDQESSQKDIENNQTVKQEEDDNDDGSGSGV